MTTSFEWESTGPGTRAAAFKSQQWSLRHDRIPERIRTNHRRNSGDRQIARDDRIFIQRSRHRIRFGQRFVEQTTPRLKHDGPQARRRQISWQFQRRAFPTIGNRTSRCTFCRAMSAGRLSTKSPNRTRAHDHVFRMLNVGQNAEIRDRRGSGESVLDVQVTFRLHFGVCGGAYDTFEIGDKVVYPNHGVGIIEKISNRLVSGKFERFYLLRIVPTTFCHGTHRQRR